MRLIILTSQLPVSPWHEQIGAQTMADGVLDRAVHNAHRASSAGRRDTKESRNPNT